MSDYIVCQKYINVTVKQAWGFHKVRTKEINVQISLFNHQSHTCLTVKLPWQLDLWYNMMVIIYVYIPMFFSWLDFNL